MPVWATVIVWNQPKRKLTGNNFKLLSHDGDTPWSKLGTTIMIVVSAGIARTKQRN